MAPPDVESPAPPTPPRRRRGARLLIVLIALWAGSAAADLSGYLILLTRPKYHSVNLLSDPFGTIISLM